MQTALTVIVAALLAAFAIIILQISEPGTQQSATPEDAALIAG